MRTRVLWLVVMAVTSLAAGGGWAAAPAPVFLPRASAVGDILVSPFTCPGILGGVCGLACQRTACGALVEFYRLTFNDSKPWTRARTTWEVVRSSPCDSIVPAPLRSGPPAFCRWMGVSCCRPTDIAAGRCSALHSVMGITLRADNVNGSLSDPALMDALEQLHACGMAELDVEGNDVGGQLLPRWGRFANLRVLNVANNWLSGTIPSELALLKNLTYLGLGTNFLQGTLGDWVGGLSRLEVLNVGSNLGINSANGSDMDGHLPGIMGTIPPSVANLTRLVELDLQTNSFHGHIPDNICGPGTNLHVLSLRGNRLSGPATSVTRCSELTALDLSANKLTGSLPATANWTKLVSLLMGNNRFGGTLPEEIYLIPILSYLDISSNMLEGTLDDRISLLIYLISFDAGGNRLSGTLTEDMFFLPQLTTLNLAGNRLTGTVQPSLGLAYGLREASFAGNVGLLGQLPDEAGGLPYLRRINLRNTSMSCVPSHVALAARQAGASGSPVVPSRCPSSALLPCFLEFEPYDAPRSDNSHLRCRPLRRKSPEAAAASCSPAIQALLQEQEQAAAAGGADGGELRGEMSEQWELPPAYYQYQGCACLHGYREQWGEGGTVLVCVPDRSLLEPWAWVLVALGGVLFLFMCALVLVASRWVLFRSRWLRDADLRRKRARWGSLKPGARLSVVVTDVEGYSELMKACPSLTRKAVAMHNAVMRKAVHDQAGHIFEQEGDSWAVAFHDAQDAVAFCLQAQQALHKVDWPLGLMSSSSLRGTGQSDDEGLASMTEGSAHSTAGAALHQRGRLRQLLGVGSMGMLLAPGQDDARGNGNRQQQEQQHQQQELQLGHLPSLNSKASREGSTISDVSATDSITNPGARPGSPRSADLASGLRRASRGGSSMSRQESLGAPASRMTSDVMSLSASASSFTEREGNDLVHHSASRTQSGGGAAMPSAASASGAPTGSGWSRRSRASHARFFSMLRAAGSAPQGRLLYGLRVRMGVASGALADEDVHSSAVFRLAKLVCDMANGGQVLLEAASFDLVKDHHEELGAVDHHGYNDRTLVGRAGLRSLWTCCDWLPCVRRSNAYAVAEGVKGSSIVCLDMGEWQVPGVNCADAFGGEDRAPAAAGSVAARTPEPKQSLLGLAHTSSGRLPRSSSIGSGACDQQRLRVYSVLPQPLAERAKVWCGALAVGPGWHQTDRGFFDAPGAAAAVLGPEDALAPPQDAAMPPVTLVFAAVEGAKALARARREADVRALAAVLGTTLLATLEAFPGGYLCRQQEGDLKYMLAFPEASAALQWCLLAQEALMYAPWPPALLSLPGLAEVHAPGDGALLFRGPRLKMGVCEGVPQSVEPDHVGRADYHGASVNQAARFMDVAAHGGQVACEEALTCGIFRAWRSGDAIRSETTHPPVQLWGGTPGGWRHSVEVPSTSARAAVENIADQSGDALALEEQREGPAGDTRPPSVGIGNGTVSLEVVRTLSGSQLRSGLRGGASSALARAAATSGSADGGVVPTVHCARRVTVVTPAEEPSDARPDARSSSTPHPRWSSNSDTQRKAVEVVATPIPLYSVAVRAYHLGTFVFKGGDPTAMVTVTSANLAQRTALTPHDEPKGKGHRVAERVGVADGAVALLPDVLGGKMREAFVGMAGAGWPASEPLGAYEKWLACELARRRLLIGERLPVRFEPA